VRPDCSKAPRERVAAVLFDFNGVLVDDEHLHFLAFRRLLAPFGVRLSRRLYDERYLSFDDLSACAAMLRDAGVPRPRRTAAVVADLVAAKRRLYGRLVRDGGVGVEAGARLLVRRLARRLPLALVSGATRSEVLLALGEARLLRRFSCIVAAEDVRRPKPHPEGYRKALELL
jgi:beta-phosphoglucomutase-like phosphatase (HAD superfamily)